MLIREWKITDLDVIVKLLTQMNEALGEDQVLIESNIKEHFVRMEEQKETYENYVLEEEQKIIGYMSLLFYRSLYHKKGTAQINELIVDEENRNKGLGKELLQYGIKRAQEREMDEIEIGVEKENIKAIKFYKDNGIEEEYLLLGKEFE